MIPFKGRALISERPVSIHRNLRGTPGDWSIKQANLVVAHSDYVVLNAYSCHINESGRLRAIREGQRNVHAFIKGNICKGLAQNTFDASNLRRIRYCLNSGFIFEDGTPLIDDFHYLVFMNKGLWGAM